MSAGDPSDVRWWQPHREVAGASAERDRLNRVLIVSENDLKARWVAACLGVAGYRLHIMGAGTRGPARLSRHCRAYEACDAAALLRKDRSLLELIDSYCRTHRIGWIVPSDLTTTLLLAHGRALLKNVRLFPLSEPELIEQWNDKAAFARLLSQRGLPTPWTFLLKSTTDPAIESLRYPAVLKPVCGEGGVGVRRVDSAAQLREVLPGHGAAFGWPLLVQEYIPGHDIDLSLLADHGRIVAWTIQQAREQDPGTLEFLAQPRVLEIGTELVRSCRFHGIVHFDLRVDARTLEPTMLEANPRFWGSLRHSLWSGVNFPHLGLQLACGEPFDRPFRPVLGLCRDPGFSTRSTLRALLRGRLRPEGLSPASEAGWRCHLDDPLPELWQRLGRLRSAFGAHVR